MTFGESCSHPLVFRSRRDGNKSKTYDLQTRKSNRQIASLGGANICEHGICKLWPVGSHFWHCFLHVSFIFFLLICAKWVSRMNDFFKLSLSSISVLFFILFLCFSFFLHYHHFCRDSHYHNFDIISPSYLQSFPYLSHMNWRIHFIYIHFFSDIVCVRWPWPNLLHFGGDSDRGEKGNHRILFHWTIVWYLNTNLFFL